LLIKIYKFIFTLNQIFEPSSRQSVLSVCVFQKNLNTKYRKREQ